MKIEVSRSEQERLNGWSIQNALDLYLIERWGAGYFDVNEKGHLTVAPLQKPGPSISIFDALQEATAQGLRPPLLIRFQDILRHRVQTLNEAFQYAIRESGYSAPYQGVYPIKVNQLREVVEEILDAGLPYNFGLEVGSKPEIFAALPIHSAPETLIVCNGYKDDAYIRTALIGRRLEKKVVLVAEKISEIERIVKIASEMQILPWIGLRIRLVSQGAGKWATSGGEHAKFGLTTSDILRGIEILREANMESALKLLHFHIGSQIPDILSVKGAVREATRYYVKLRQMGHQIDFLDVGGGLAIDYDGSRSTFHSSMNYSVEEYAKDVVYNIMDICNQESVPHPTIVSESGRAIVAHHSVLVVEAFGSIKKGTESPPERLPRTDHKLVEELLYVEEHLVRENISESLHDLVQIKQESQKMFEVGLLDLEVKASVEILYWRITEAITRLAADRDDLEMTEEILDLRSQLADQHICNFSVFQSLLDHWALGQLFPVVPIHRLDEPPATESALVDITCDSDGKVGKFIDISDVRDTLPLHSVDNNPYYLGIFLTGAYQDIMGDIHNLFGRVNEAHVFLDDNEESGFYIEEKIRGNTISEVLAMTQYDSRDLVKKLKGQIDAAIKQDQLRANEGMKLLSDFENGLQDQTYLVL